MGGTQTAVEWFTIDFETISETKANFDVCSLVVPRP